MSFIIGQNVINGRDIEKEANALRTTIKSGDEITIHKEQLDGLKWALQWMDGYPSEPMGINFIHEGFFKEYVQDEVDDQFGCADSWIVIDWDATVLAVQQDYKQIDIGGETYWTRR